MSSHRLYRASALVVALLWTAMPLAAMAHVELEQHSYCAEHQALEHGPLAAATDETAPENSEWRAGGELPEHEECLLADDCLRLHRKANPPDLSIAAPNSLHRRMLVEHQTIIALIPLIRAAPKTSPPALFAAS